MMSFRKQFAILSGLTLLFVGPFLLLHGTNIVTHTYAFGAKHLLQGLTPYIPPEGGRDWFKYSPFFGILYYPISLLQSRAQAFAWGAVNILVFWGGVSRNFKLGKDKSWWVWLAFIAASMELDGSSRYQQMNSFLIGLSLLGVADFREGKYFRAGFLLAVATNIKIIPVSILAPLCLPPKPRYLWGVASGLVFAFFFPAIFLGFGKNISFVQQWFGLIFKDLNSSGVLDVVSGATRIGISEPKLWVALPITILSVVGLLTVRFVTPDLGKTVALAVLSILLLSPRTESPTFVFIGAAYLFLMEDILKTKGVRKTVYLMTWFAGFFFVSLCQNDIWPRAIWNAGTWQLFNKTFGTLILWLLCLVMVGQGVKKLKYSRPS
jgi:hypothetical protein